MITGEADTTSRAVVRRMERLLARLAGRTSVRHVVAGLASIDETWSWTGAAGNADETGRPMQADTPWFLASVTKLYIAAVVLRLTERDVIGLGEPVQTYLPDTVTRGLHVIDGVDRTGEITVAHLLGHLSGLPDYLDARMDSGRTLVEEILQGGDRRWSFEEAVALARDRMTPYFPPSDPNAASPRIRYSDTNYVLLMLLAQEITGSSMGELFRDLLFEPLGLWYTWVPGSHPIETPAQGPATVWAGRHTLADRPLALESFGDLYATTTDALRFGRALFGGEVFEREETARMLTTGFNRFAFPRGMSSLRAPSWPIEYSRGMMRFAPSRWMSTGLRVPALIGHTGSTGSWLWFCPEVGVITAGTVDQTSAATVPFRMIPRIFLGAR